jgi:pimeloyl-ACP methyl ester carboxylesterase
MPRILSSSPINSTSVLFLLRLLTRRAALRASAALVPRAASLWAEQLFLTPPLARHRAIEAFDLIEARSGFVKHKTRHIATWTWGERDAPAVLLVHGWGGTATQMRRFVHPLTAAGYRVIAYDQPAHGLSEGRLTGLPDFADALAEVAWHHGGIEGVVAHSLGAAATAFALARSLRVRRAVLFSPPADLLGYSRRFARWHWIPEAVRVAMQSAIDERFGVRWAEFELARIAPRLATEALVIHDRGDRMVPWTQGAKFARHWPGARLLLTDDLGHGRILEDELTVRAAADFIAGRSKVASAAAPAIPQPAPVY